jgi:hypothetical protein
MQHDNATEYKVHGGKMRGSTKMVHFRHAASRHYNDGELLIKNGRQANAGQLYGFTAECGIKWLLVWKGYPTDPISGEIVEKGKKFRAHIHELIKNIHLVHTFLDGRGALKYMAMIPGIGSFSDWKTDHRYYIDSALPPSLLNWQKAAREIMQMLDEATLDGETT